MLASTSLPTSFHHRTALAASTPQQRNTNAACMSKGYLCDEPPTISAIHCLPLARHWFLHSYSHLSDDKSTYLVVSFMPTFNAVRIETRQAIDEFLSRRWYGNITQQDSADLLKSVQQLRHCLVHQSTSIPDSALVNSLSKLKDKRSILPHR